MAYAISYRGIDGQASLYARIKRVEGGQWWDDVAQAWVDDADADCNVTLTEASGVYTATANMSPIAGLMYKTFIYSASGVLLGSTESVYNPSKKTALKLVNAVNQKLGYKDEANFTTRRATTVLAHVNQAIRLLQERTTWSELKVKGSIGLIDGRSVYTIFPVNSSIGVDTIRRLSITTYEPLVILMDGKFESYVASLTEEGQPIHYRIKTRAGGGLTIEVAPTPDQAYVLDYSALLKCEELSATTDVTPLDDDLVILGGVALMKTFQGDTSGSEISEWNALFSAEVGSEEEPGFEELDPYSA